MSQADLHTVGWTSMLMLTGAGAVVCKAELGLYGGHGASKA